MVLVVQGILLTLVALVFGLRAPPLGIVVALLLVAVVALATSAASYAMALQLKSEDALAPLLGRVVLRCCALGRLLPMTLAPAWLSPCRGPTVRLHRRRRARGVPRVLVSGGRRRRGRRARAGRADRGLGVRTFQRESA